MYIHGRSNNTTCGKFLCDISYMKVSYFPYYKENICAAGIAKLTEYVYLID